jgi:hypothetical protein
MTQLFLSALFGLLAGLVGTGFQAYLQRQDKADERLERRKERRREKAEEVFTELSALVRAYSDLSLDVMRQANGQKEVTITPASNARISSLLLVYFPELVPLLDAFDNDMKQIANDTADELRKDDNFKDPDKERGAMVLNAFSFSQRAAKFAEDLRPKLQQEIQKLW